MSISVVRFYRRTDNVLVAAYILMDNVALGSAIINDGVIVKWILFPEGDVARNRLARECFRMMNCGSDKYRYTISDCDSELGAPPNAQQ